MNVQSKEFWLNVKKANISSKAEQIVYALGATCGGISGLLITKLI